MKRLVVIFALAASSMATGAAAREPVAVREAQWLADDADLVAFLTSAPAECLAAPEDEDARYKVEVGRVAFRSPFLLGGQAARGRLSCNACHINGRGNSAFYLEGLSAAPGTADVTSSLFSAVREDRLLNAKPIPDLAGRSEAAGASPHPITDFIASAVTEEFQGAVPPRAILDGLAAYVSALQPAACEEETTRQTPRRAMRDAIRALRVAEEALTRGDTGVADFALVSAQGELGRIAERFPNSVAARHQLEVLSVRIGKARAIAGGAPKGARVRLEEAMLEAKRVSFALHRARAGSLFDPGAAALLVAAPAGGSE